MTQTAQAPLTPWQPVKEPTWRRFQAKRAFEIVLGKMLQPEHKNPGDDLVPYLRALNVQWERLKLEEIGRMWAAPQEIEALELKQGDLLVCEGGEVGRAARINVELPDNTIIQNALHRVRGSEIGDVGYLSYCLRHAADVGWFEVICNRATIAHFTVEKFRDLWLNLPDLPTQRRIADFLDRETAQIDALIEAKEQMLALLQEKRAAQISHMVTKGLDPNVAMKDSGLEWLGEIPAHWEIKTIKRVSWRIDTGTTPSAEYMDGSMASNHTWFTPGDFSGETHLETSRRKIPVEAIEAGEAKVFAANSIMVIGIGATLGKTAMANTDFSANQQLNIIQPSKGASPTYLLYVLQEYEKVFRAYANTATLPILNQERLAAVLVPVPPIKEQEVIANVIGIKFDGDREIIKLINESILLLRERRSALITAAVTGQMAEVLG